MAVACPIAGKHIRRGERMHGLVKMIAEYLAIVAESIAIIFIVIGILGAVRISLTNAFKERRGLKSMTESRLYLGHALSIALEFLIGADILRTAIAPSWEDIGKLGAIVGIRTLLNYFLSRELAEMEVSTKPE